VRSSSISAARRMNLSVIAYSAGEEALARVAEEFLPHAERQHDEADAGCGACRSAA
jgi:hypothetical protein